MFKSLSVFLPTYNEEGNIKKVIENTKKVLQKNVKNWEIIIVNDGSKDSTKDIANKLAKLDKRIRVVSHDENKGYGSALKTGFENSKYPWVAFTDSDGQFDFAEITKFIKESDNADLILGVRKKRADSLARKIFTFGWSLLARIMLGLKARDYSCGFKMIKKKVYVDILPLVGEEKVTQIEMLVKARKKGFRFAEIPVSHYPRKFGQPTGAKLKVVIKSLIDMFMLFGKMHKISKKEFILILLILAVGAFFRLFRISEYMTFLGDEGRDAIIVRRLLVDGDPILIGPGTSIGGMYLGPLYYYLIAPALLLFNFSPVGPAVLVALIGIATIALVWWLGREWFSKTVGLLSAFLYAISPTVITFSRSSWNPNIMPFFALLSVFSIYKVWKEKRFSWLILTAISFAFVLQSHYLGLLLFPVLALFWFLSKPIYHIRYSIYALAIFAFLMSPLLIFDLRHDYMNTKALTKFLTVRQETVSVKPWKALPNIYPIFEEVNTSLLAAKNVQLGTILSIIMVLTIIIHINIVKKNPVFWILISWFGVGLIGLGLYKQHIYDHYFGFLFPIPFLVMGLVLDKIYRSRYKIFCILLFSILFYVNIINNPLLFHPNKQLERSQLVAQKILQESKGEFFNFAVLAQRNYEDGYGYFLEKAGANVMHADRWKPSTIADTLFVVCEMEKTKCDPTHSPKAEVANFGMSEISDQWEVSGVTIYKLIHVTDL